MRGSLLRRCCCVVVVLLAGMVLGCGRAPQLGEDEAVWKETEALYTAVTARRTELVDESTQRFAALHQDGRITPAVFQKLEHVVQLTRSGQWDSASRELWQFMRRQRKG